MYAFEEHLVDAFYECPRCTKHGSSCCGGGAMTSHLPSRRTLPFSCKEGSESFELWASGPISAEITLVLKPRVWVISVQCRAPSLAPSAPKLPVELVQTLAGERHVRKLSLPGPAFSSLSLLSAQSRTAAPRPSPASPASKAAVCSDGETNQRGSS